MKKLLAILPLLALFVILFAGCEKEKFSSSTGVQLVLFQVEYSNYAWGYQHNGLIIDSAGNVRRFNYPENWHNPDNEGYITEANMNENFRQLGQVALFVEKDTLEKFFNLLRPASFGKLSDPYSRMADAGIAVYSGYFYYALEKRYKQVLIKQWGDVEIDNASNAAGEIFNWLVSVNTKAQRSGLVKR